MTHLENIFNLSQPELYDCYIERYHSSFHVVRIRAERIDVSPGDTETLLEMVFTDVLYFEGPFHWTGANICIEPRDTCLDTLLSARLLTDESGEDDVEETLENYHLFTVQSASGFQIKMIAHNSHFTVNIIG